MINKRDLQAIEGFPPIVAENVKVLVLGSMPSAQSLAKQQYYGHPRNAFWPIMGELFGAAPALSYQQRTAILLKHRVAVWDVLKSCQRQGSLDAGIDPESIRTNDLAVLYAYCPLLKQVFFNGGTAQAVYNKHILPQLTGRFGYLQYQRLPSTSPAHAAMNLQQKINAWRVIMTACDTL